MKTKTTSAKKKLIPAAAMLAVSAAMLTTATYAWFTMSKEVEVTGIQMTAVVPQGLQISLGKGQNSGKLTALGSGSGAKLVQAPVNDDASADWNNSVAFYNFYQAPKLTPASSTDGASIFTTDDADGVGKTVKADGKSIDGTEGTLILVDTKTVEPSDSTDRADYVEFPVWIRNAGDSDVTLSVRATAADGENSSAASTAANADNKLYKAARISIIKSADGEAAPTASDGVIIPYDGTTAQTTAKYYSTGKALTATGTLGEQGSAPTYGSVVAVAQNTASHMTANPDGDAIITVPGKTSSAANYNGNCNDASDNYGDAVCFYVRVWLEGEDKDCFNATAGQDFKVELEFTQK